MNWLIRKWRQRKSARLYNIQMRLLALEIEMSTLRNAQTALELFLTTKHALLILKEREKP